MIYGLYQSAAGMITALHQQNVVSNNLANAETSGFRRDLAMIQQRKTAAQELPGYADYGEDMLNQLGGGQFLSRSEADFSPGIVSDTNNPYDVAIMGKGFLTVSKDGQQFLTRDGRFLISNNGELTLSGNPDVKVLDRSGKPVVLDRGSPFLVDSQGVIRQHGGVVAQLGVKNPDTSELSKHEEGLFTSSSSISDMPQMTTCKIQQGAEERSNVEPTFEITQLLEAQRTLEANANMIRYQDQTLGRLVNDVAKV